jgi:hypothetical protein
MISKEAIKSILRPLVARVFRWEIVFLPAGSRTNGAPIVLDVLGGSSFLPVRYTYRAGSDSCATYPGWAPFKSSPIPLRLGACMPNRRPGVAGTSTSSGTTPAIDGSPSTPTSRAARNEPASENWLWAESFACSPRPIGTATGIGSTCSTTISRGAEICRESGAPCGAGASRVWCYRVKDYFDHLARKR